jgi:L-rhamnonate dehydratase
VTGPSRIIEVRASPLAARQVNVPALPDWAAPALRPPPPVPWPENDELFVLEVESDDGAVGSYGPCTRTTVQVVRDQIAPLLIGCPPAAHRAQPQQGVLGRHRSGAHLRVALSAGELAVTDLVSRRSGVPVSAVLGGPTRHQVAAYASALGVEVDHPLAPQVAAWIAEQDYYGQKWSLPGFGRGEEPHADLSRLARIRDAIGPQSRLMVDALGGWSVDYAIRMARGLAELDVAWLEEPLAPGNTVGLAAVRSSSSSVPLAVGEHAYDHHDQIRMIVTGEVDIWQPDVGWGGGLRTATQTTDLAAAFGLRVFPHGASLAAATALAGITDPAVLPAVEYHLTQEPLRQACLQVPMEPAAGVLPIRSGPGLCDGYLIDGGPPVMLASAMSGDVPDTAGRRHELV